MSSLDWKGIRNKSFRMKPIDYELTQNYANKFEAFIKVAVVILHDPKCYLNLAILVKSPNTILRP